ncbi:MAG: heavy-metal-associated domain-containing protein [Clostridia bacterium]|nr:heavy-metal-associated domain-containing protein [Clostridia bacterium]
MYRTIAKIDGMMCAMCESHVNDCVRNNFSVKKVSSSRTKGETEIISDEELDTEKLKAAIEKTGYKVTDVTTEPYESRKFSLFKK